MLFRSLTVGCFISLAVLSPCGFCAPVDTDLRPTDSFRSELWRMEFQESEEQKSDDLPDTVLDDSRKPGRRAIVVRGPGAELETLSQKQLNQRPLVRSGIPGQTQLKELQAETPFAEWLVDKAAEGNVRRVKVPASAWTMSQTYSARPSIGAIPLINGPSILTFLVAVVAGIVMIGAFFSGRE
ncbi:MAG: hypothetical protein R3C59_11135 [Planctomycetaceae bacterium]